MSLKSVPNIYVGKVNGCCKVHGAIVAEAMMKDAEPAFEVTCPTCAIENRKTEDKRTIVEIQVQRKKAIKSRIDRGGIPERFRGKLLDDYNPITPLAEKHLAECKAYAREFDKHRQQGSNLIFCGKPGTGKTHLACAIAQEVVQSRNDKIQYTTSSKMLREIRSTYSSSRERSETDAIGTYTGVDLLIIDEIGVNVPTDNAKALLFEIIDERYQKVLPTIVISNLRVSEIKEQTGVRLVDRLKANGTLMTFDWVSYR